MRRAARVLLLTFFSAAVSAMAALIATTLRNPVGVQRAVGRLSLRRAGFRRRSLRGPRGPLVLWEAGYGPAVVLLHGFSGDATFWAPTARRLLRHARIILPDLPGHGDSSPLEGVELSLDDWLDALDAITDEEGGPVVLAGSSLGGWAAAAYTLRRPERVSALALVHAAGLRRPQRPDLLLGRDADEVRALARALLPSSPPLPGFVVRALGRHLRTPRLHALWRDLDARGMVQEGLGELRCPVHLVWGTDDGFFPPEVAEHTLEVLPHATLHRVGRGGHLPQVLRPAQVAWAIRAAIVAGGRRASQTGP